MVLYKVIDLKKYYKFFLSIFKDYYNFIRLKQYFKVRTIFHFQTISKNWLLKVAVELTDKQPLIWHI